MKKITLLLITLFMLNINAQQIMTPELLWQVKRISPVGLTKDNRSVVFNVTSYNVSTEEKIVKKYVLPIKNGKAQSIEDFSNLIEDSKISPNGKWKLVDEKVKLEKVNGEDFYPNLKKSNVKIYDDLMYRHWDTWANGTYNHVFIKSTQNPNVKIDIMEGKPYHSPTVPFGGGDDYIWSPDGTKVLYVTKKATGKAYATSTNTDIFEYDVETKITKNLTEGMMGYDTHPAYSSKGTLAFLSMRRDGYESDKNDIIVLENGKKINLTQSWDGTVNSFKWNKTGNVIYFNAPVNGTIQLFSIDYKKGAKPQQITNGDFDVNALVGLVNNSFIVTRSDMNHANELYSINLANGSMKQISFVNKDLYSKIKLSEVKRRNIKTSDGKNMLAWVIYPPDFDPTKKYPTLLYCQGGPQSALSQFYSFRWNFQLMAAQGYIVIAPNRRGMPGHGVDWNEAISKDWGGQVMDDYLAAIDDIAKEKYVDKDRLGAVGASYGGYSVFYIAGIHNNRFKTFIAHDGVFNLKSMYGTTEELFFTNWDFGGAYWDKNNTIAQNTYKNYNPINNVSKWNTPILIIQGGKDFRVPIGQGLEAFQAAQLQNIKSRLLYFPDENHWVLNPQNAIVWQSEFFKWLKETL